MRYQPIYDIAEICYRMGVRHAVLCPGSRCAPLTLAFARHTGITTRTFSDERSAGFIALGMAQGLNGPVVIVTTSGTAAYNLAPAVAEAFFSRTPLLVITADRPAEWIAQQDGQTIYQQELYGRHVNAFFSLPQDYEHPDSRWAINRIVNEAINTTRLPRPGPVHINAPFREPLYPPAGENEITYSDVRTIAAVTPPPTGPAEPIGPAQDMWSRFHRVLVVAGQGRANPALTGALQELQQHFRVPVVHDIVSNLHGLDGDIAHSDLFLGQGSDRLKARLQPDLLITFGDGLISKNLKIFLRNHAPQEHWHIDASGTAADTFQGLTHMIRMEPTSFLQALLRTPSGATFETQKQENYFRLWEVEERRVRRVLETFVEDKALHELALVSRLLEALPDGSFLHLANSMSVRYANFIGLQAGRNITVCSNRGTSGIDGSNSTAVGHALVNSGPHFLVTGDLAFFYDRNAFWHNYALPNLRVLLLNNHGGLIFDVLDGPSSTPEAREYFITRQNLNARKLCEEFGFDYLALDKPAKIKNMFNDFLRFDGPVVKVLEYESDTTRNKKVLENLKQKIRDSYES